MQELAAAIASEAALRSRLAEATAQLERERYQSRAWKAEHDRVEAAHRKTLRSRLRRAVKALGKGPYRSLETYRRDVLAGVEPSVVLDDWAARTAGRKSFVMLCHDQMIDRRIIHQARSLTAAGWAGIIVAVSSDADDHIETAEGVPVHRIGLARIIPDCPVYWRQQNRQRLIQWWGRWQGLLHKLDQWWYAAELRTVYHCRSVTYPLPFDRCYYAAAKHYRAGVIVVHDLPALGAAHQLAREWSAVLVYDSHELYTEQHMLSRTQRKILDRHQREIAPACDAIITVGPSIARHLSRQCGVPMPEVIMSVTSCREALPKGRKFHERLGLPADDRVMLFQGSVAPSQNMHTLVRGFRQWNRRGFHLVFLGPSEPRTMAMLQRLAGDRLGRTIHFLPPVGQDVLLQYTASADVGLIPYLPYDLNCRYCMPNKLFEYIQAGLPVLANDLVELRRVLGEIGGGGMLADLSDARACAGAMEAMASRDLAQDRQALLAARRKFSWDTEQQKYLAIVERLGGQAQAAHAGGAPARQDCHPRDLARGRARHKIRIWPMPSAPTAIERVPAKCSPTWCRARWPGERTCWYWRCRGAGCRWPGRSPRRSMRRWTC